MRLLTLVVGLLLSLGSAPCFAGSSDASNASVQDLSVQDATFDVTSVDNDSYVTTMGSIKNASAACFDELVVEIKYFDANKTLVDTITQPLYGIVVPPSEEVAFRVRDIAAKPKTAYTSQSIRVISAEPRSQGRNSSGVSSTIAKVLASWGPILLLIGVWVYFMQRMRRKDSPQERTLALIQQQNGILEAQYKVLERLTVAVETMVRR